MNKLKLNLPDPESLAVGVASFLLFATVIAVVVYSIADTYYGTSITVQMTVVDKEKVLVNSENNTYSYRADLLEDGATHYGVSFSHSHWRQLGIGRTYRMTCIEGHYSQAITTCSP